MKNVIRLRLSTFIVFSTLIFTISVCKAQDNKSTILTYPYSIETPENYDPKSDTKHSLLIFLHGAGERGTDLNMLNVHGPLKLIKEGRKFDAIVFAPLCPKNVWWDINSLQQTLDEVKTKYNIDESDIFLTGLSMGGYGTWLWTGAYPNQFKRIAPICGGGDVKDAKKLAQIPIWAFHGGTDNVVLPSESQEMIDAILSAGGDPILTIYPDAGHDSWTATYNNEEFWLWLMK